MLLKRLLGIVILLTVGLLVITSCQSHLTTPIPLGYSQHHNIVEAPDDIVDTPGGSYYRANVHQQGVENPWSHIETVGVQLVNGSDVIYVGYRSNIETKAGEIRNNILNIRKENGLFDGGGLSSIRLYSIGTLSGLRLFQEGGGGFPGTIASVLVIEIPPDTKPGQYNLEIGLEILGTDYGTIPCTINVIQ
jgi:hypothetical protein